MLKSDSGPCLRTLRSVTRSPSLGEKGRGTFMGCEFSARLFPEQGRGQRLSSHPFPQEHVLSVPS